jgi:hypothetical protein
MGPTAAFEKDFNAKKGRNAEGRRKETEKDTRRNMEQKKSTARGRKMEAEK